METQIVSSPEEQGMDSAKLALVFDEVTHGKYKETHGIYAVRNGAQVFEAYFYPYSADCLHNMFSVTKSLASALIGIAIKEGLLEGVHQKVLDFFPEIAARHTDPRKLSLTIEHMLTMTSGLEWDDEDSLKACMNESDDWVAYMFDQPLVAEAGEQFNYHSGCSYVLTAIVDRVAGMPTKQFADTYLFGPLGITDYYWCTDPNGVLIGGFGAHLKPSDMVKLGQLYLNGGEYQGHRIITEDWVKVSTRKHTDNGYGFHWWVIEEENRYAASGYGGQFIHVLPESNMVVAITNGGGYELPPSLFAQAIVSDELLPPNPEAQALIAERARLAEQAPPIVRQPIPELAERISNRRIVLEPNRGNYESIVFDFATGRQDEADIVFGLVGGEQQRCAIGLDNRHRISRARAGINAPEEGIATIHDFSTLYPRLLPAYTVGRTGFWRDAHTFVLYNEAFETGFVQHMIFRFEDNTVSIEAGIPSYEDMYTIAGRWGEGDGA